MIYSLAPMEGITGHAFRRVHAECFGALDRYYTPFLPPPRVGSPFGGKNLREIDPVNNEGLNVIPQLLTKNADEFVWAAGLLADLGYDEVNLNLGCPSGTVVSKGKGSGFLRNLDELEVFLRDVCDRSLLPVGYDEVNLNLGCPSGTVVSKGKGSGFLRNLDELEVFLRDVCDRSLLPVSVKTRLGLESDAEYERILELYCSLPLAELIVHPRVQKDRYQGKPRWEPYGETLACAPFPVAYNGDVFCEEERVSLVAAYPQTRHIMLGRGLLANPALRRIRRRATSCSDAGCWPTRRWRGCSPAGRPRARPSSSAFTTSSSARISTRSAATPCSA